MKLRVVIDHSTHVAAILSKDGASAAVVELALAGKISNYISDGIIAELRGVLLRPKFKLSPSKVSEFMEIIEKSSIKAVLSRTTGHRPVACFWLDAIFEWFLTLRIPLIQPVVLEHNRFHFAHSSKMSGMLLFQ